MSFKRVLTVSDFHCGSEPGLTPPPWQQTELGGELWEAFEEMIEPIRPIDILVGNGDLIDGKSYRTGGTDVITTDRVEQVEMAVEVVNFIDAKENYFTYGCLTAGHRVLTSDLRWVSVEELKEGDTLLAFEEYPQSPRVKRQMVTSTVTSNQPTQAEVCEIQLSDGSTITATWDHPFLVRRGSPYTWQTVRQMYNWAFFKDGTRKNRSPISFKRNLPVWEPIKSYDAGYLAAFFDGEGSCSQRQRPIRNDWPESTLRVNGYQNENAMLDTTTRLLKDFGFQFNVSPRHNSENKNIQLLGGRSEVLRFLGTIRPKRLLDIFDPNKLGSFKSTYDNDITIVNIVPMGVQTVYGLGTTSGTYISEGFLSHNTPYHTGKDEDFEAIIASNVGGTIEGQLWLEVYGVMFDVKHFVPGSSIPHGRHTSVAKDRLWNLLWADIEQQPRSDILIRSHVHYHSYCGGSNWVAMTTPALQGLGCKFGSRIPSGTVDYGITWFDVYDDGSFSWDTNIILIQTQRIEPYVIGKEKE
jgi:hypothetical protein